MNSGEDKEKGSVLVVLFWLSIILPAVSLPFWGWGILFSEIPLGTVLALVAWLLYIFVIGILLLREFGNGKKNGWKW